MLTTVGVTPTPDAGRGLGLAGSAAPVCWGPRKQSPWKRHTLAHRCVSVIISLHQCYPTRQKQKGLSGNAHCLAKHPLTRELPGCVLNAVNTGFCGAKLDSLYLCRYPPPQRPHGSNDKLICSVLRIASQWERGSSLLPGLCGEVRALNLFQLIFILSKESIL